MPDKRCLIKSCKQVTGRVFPIPSLEVVDEHVFKVWFENLDKDKSNFDRPYGICIRHFAEDAFIPAHENRDKYGRPLKTINLKKDAIPTLFLDNPDTNDPLRVVPIKTLECTTTMPTKRCLIKSCTIKESAKPVFRVPSLDEVAPEVLIIWRNVIDQSRTINRNDSLGVCARHFSEDAFVPAAENKDKYGHYYKTPKLKPDAIPTLFLFESSNKNPVLANKNTSGNPPYKFSNADSNSSLFLGPTKTENYPTKSYIIKSSDISHGKSGGPNPLPLEKPNYPDIDMAISGFPTTGNRNVPGTTTTTPVFVKRDPEICSPEVLQSETKIINPVTGTGASSLTDPLMEDESSIDMDDDPWNIQSLFELQFFICPSCQYKNSSRQDFLNHACNSHPESIKSLKKIKDRSISDLIFPWNNSPIQINIKQEIPYTSNTFEKDFTSDNNSNDGTTFSHESENNISDTNNAEEDDTNNEMKIDILNQFKQELITSEDFNADEDDTFHDDQNNSKDDDTEELFQCYVCSQSFDQKRYLKTHLENTHTSDEKLTCQDCGKLFKSKRSLDGHKKEKHSGSLEVHTCTICGNSFGRRTNLTAHMKLLHTTSKNLDETVKKFKCHFCDLSYGRRQHLKAHIFHIHKGSVSPTQSRNKKQKTESGKPPEVKANKVMEMPDFLKKVLISSEDGNSSSKSKSHFVCSKCDKRFRTMADLSKHIKAIHEVDGKCYECGYCKSYYINLQGLQFHQNEMHTGQPGFHKVHQVSGSTIEEFVENLNKIKGGKGNKNAEMEDKTYKCNACGEEFKKLSLLVDHRFDKHIDVYKDGLTCFCGKKFEKSASLTAHYLRVHDTEFTEDPIPEECHICGKQFKTKRKLRLHREGIHEGKRHKCHYCEKDFGHYFSLKKHISYEHEGTSAKIPCERCGKTFFGNTHLKRHVESVHEGIKNEKCDICSKTYYYKHALRKHKQIAHEGLIYQCHICEKSYTTESFLKVHIDIHEGIIKYQCTRCKKAFLDSRRLRRHVESVHEGIKNHTCSFNCGMSFYALTDMKIHVETVHTKTRREKLGNRFTCDKCGKTFMSTKDCERHVEQVHEGIRRHFCEHCGKGFYNKADANRHIDAVHLNLPDVWKRKKKS